MKLIMEGWRDFLSEGRQEGDPSSVVSALMNRGGLSQSEAEDLMGTAAQVQSSPEGQQALEVAAQDPEVQAALERAAAELQQGSLKETDLPGQEEREMVGGVVAGGASGAFATQAVALTAWPELMAAVAELPQIAALVGGGGGAVAGLGLALLINHLRRTGKIDEGWGDVKKTVGKAVEKIKGLADPAEEETSPGEPEWEKHQAASSRNVADARAKRPRGGSRGSFE
jgi:hypothetical protein